VALVSLSSTGLGLQSASRVCPTIGANSVSVIGRGLIAGVEPYAAKGVSDEALPVERSHDAASVAELFEAFAAEARARRPTRR
jgi:hypothetical protein